MDKLSGNAEKRADRSVEDKHRTGPEIDHGRRHFAWLTLGTASTATLMSRSAFGGTYECKSKTVSAMESAKALGKSYKCSGMDADYWGSSQHSDNWPTGMWPTKMFSSVVTTIPTPAFNGNLREVLHKNGNPQLPGTCTALVNELSTTAPADRSEKIQRERFEAAALKFLQASNKCGPCVVACLLNSVKFGDLYALSYESVHDDFVSAWSIEFPPASFEAATDELKRRRRALNALRRYLGRFYS